MSDFTSDAPDVETVPDPVAASEPVESAPEAPAGDQPETRTGDAPGLDAPAPDAEPAMVSADGTPIGHDDQGTMVPADSTLDVSRNADNVNVDPGPPFYDEKSATVELPTGTAYAKPDGTLGVIGIEDAPAGRPLYGASIEALFGFASEVRKESTYH
jgi:hypothetical protein